ncbi:MAG TPA: hypothetical protein VFZ22_09810 [Pyrinomonadaceae bacterium]|nr:hypothetical protein [Pyrinomonadaceae bacterium]
MSQLRTLIWLKWKLLRNQLRSRKAVVNKLATILGMLAALALSLLVAFGLGLTAYGLTQEGTVGQIFRRATARQASASVEFIFFSILAFMYLMWATVPLSIGGGKQFDAGKMLMYPITLRKLFAVDFISEFTTLHSIFAVPAILALSIGAGLGTGNLGIALIGAIPATLFGVSLSKWLTTTIGSVLRRKRGRGETIVALIGAVAAMGGALAGQIAPILIRHAESVRSLRWTPPGAAAMLLVNTRAGYNLDYALAFVTLSVYTIILIVFTYWIARRTALGLGGRRKPKAAGEINLDVPAYTGWQLPLLSPDLSAVVEKELRYALRNAQIRMMALMPLILIFIRVFNTKNFGSMGQSPNADTLLAYSPGLYATGAVLYVFLILSSLWSNAFAFEEGGMRSFILSPIDRRKILIGKNIAVTVLAFVFSTLLLVLNAIVFRDLAARDLVFVALSFVVFASFMSIYGNWVSIRFPKRMRFGKRMNVSGVGGLLLIPMIAVLGTPPFLAGAAGYFTRNIYISYATLALFALLSAGIYAIAVNFQGRSLAKREIEILETVREPADE